MFDSLLESTCLKFKILKGQENMILIYHNNFNTIIIITKYIIYIYLNILVC